ncbi:ATP-binding cassette domain-containing protein [Shimia marina]|uniref:Methionine import ATP-binding protein MetN 2 n=1 Tax=Shimia marina TaxID=321267 RepID=A0A0P1EM24_9RHOB|nr:ATP-binding cassette domain-containing protein [Shimia marina]CUH51415.1 Methionine import ATP-binding protein MetN 2 [Shimia marina]SFD49785.1 peptide/nickel transport system ATP-binding protein [Shimia marina]
MGSGQNIVLQVDELGHSYRPEHRGWLTVRPELRPLRDVSFTVRAGRILGIIGNSGAGKSTLLRILRGLERPESGHVRLMGKDLYSLKHAQLRRLRWGFQYLSCETVDALPVNRTAFDLVARALKAHGLTNTQVRKARVEEALRLLEFSFADGQKPVRALSQYQRQRLVIAVAIACRPHLIMVDELAQGMDLSVQAGMLKLLLELQDILELTLVVSSANLSIAGSFCDDLVILQDGEVVEAGPAHRVMWEPAHAHTQHLLQQARQAEVMA